MISIPGYKIDKKIGSGGMAEVYLGHQISVDRPVAIKVMSPSLTVDESFAKRFIKEANVGSLSHPNIITVFDAGKVDNNHYIIMEYISGGDLATLVVKQQLTFEQKIDIIKRIATALGYSYDKGFIHRDVKPENILFREDGTPVLADFGIAKVVSATTSLTSVGTAIGSPYYMSPEQTRGLEVDHRSDLYSLAVVFYELLCGYKPFESGDTYAIGIKHISEAIPPLPVQLVRYQPLFDRMLAKDPNQRYQNSDQFISAIDTAIGADGSTVIQPAVEIGESYDLREPEQNSTNKPKKTSKAIPIASLLVIAVLVIVVVIGAIAATYFLSNKQDTYIPDSTSDNVIGEQAISSEHNRLEQEHQRISLQIEQLLFRAEQIALHASTKQINRDELTKIYREILVLDDANQTAVLGLEMLAALYLQKAEGYFQHKKISAAKDKLTRSLNMVETSDAVDLQKRIQEYEAKRSLDNQKQKEQQVDASSPVLSKPAPVKTEQEILKPKPQISEKERLAKQKADKIDGLLKKAELRVEQEKLIQPAMDNAYYFYQQVLKISRKNNAAKNGIKNIAVLIELDLGKALKGKRLTFIEETAIQLLDYPEFIEIAEAYMQKVAEVRQRTIPLSQNEIQDKLIGGGKGPVLVKIPAGSFMMGDIQGSDSEGDEKPIHQVSIPTRFAIGKYEVTFDQYEMFTKSSGKTSPADNGFGRGERPVINVSWQDAQAYVKWLSKQAGEIYRLPTEAEWEYAARGNTESNYSWGNSIGKNNANCYGCSGGYDNKKTAEVGHYQENGFGLFDMHGNVWEWVQDCWHDRYDNAPSDGSSWAEKGCDGRVLRGGSWKNYPLFIRSANRDWYEANRSSNQFGFRVVREY